MYVRKVFYSTDISVWLYVMKPHWNWSCHIFYLLYTFYCVTWIGFFNLSRGLRGAVSLALAMTVSRDPRLDQATIGDKVGKKNLLHLSFISYLWKKTRLIEYFFYIKN